MSEYPPTWCGFRISRVAPGLDDCIGKIVEGAEIALFEAANCELRVLWFDDDFQCQWWMPTWCLDPLTPAARQMLAIAMRPE